MFLRSWLGLKPKPKPVVPNAPHALAEPKLGMQSPLVLAKIGNDLRQEYDDLLQQPLPDEIQQIAGRLPGASEVLPFPRDPKSEI